ncbi:alcohol dehydrogenase [Bisporella sp. PMI_857]|nr:alcohol dehydrogenase [Bisporella sp. PMI_857]
MHAVVFKGPNEVFLEEREIPKLEKSTDIVVKVKYAALCGSELHVYRGHQKCTPGFIMGHEFIGYVEHVGAAVQNLSKGDLVVAPFTTSCGFCFYCSNGYSSRCEKGQLFGCPLLDGAQAEFVRVPLADGTVVKAPEGIDELKLCLMADIFPTGYFAASNAFSDLGEAQSRQSTVVLVGCGPVGLCALVNTLRYMPKNLIAVDGVEQRLEQARKLGAEPWNYLTDSEGLKERVKKLTDGRGADIVIEVVGSSAALRMGFEILRPWGRISSVGVHNGEVPWTAKEAYGKNLKLQMGRCPVRSIFPDALESLKRTQHLLDFMTGNVMPLGQAIEGYKLFDAMKVQKVIFKVT